MSKKFSGYSASWTQPYTDWQPYKFQDFGQQQPTKPTLTVDQMLEQLDFIDQIVDSMLTYPHADAIIKNIQLRGK